MCRHCFPCCLNTYEGIVRSSGNCTNHMRSSGLAKAGPAFRPFQWLFFLLLSCPLFTSVWPFRSGQLVGVALICVSLIKLPVLSIFLWSYDLSFKMALISIFITIVRLYFRCGSLTTSVTYSSCLLLFLHFLFSFLMLYLLVCGRSLFLFIMSIFRKNLNFLLPR